MRLCSGQCATQPQTDKPPDHSLPYSWHRCGVGLATSLPFGWFWTTLAGCFPFVDYIIAKGNHPAPLINCRGTYYPKIIAQGLDKSVRALKDIQKPTFHLTSWKTILTHVNAPPVLRRGSISSWHCSPQCLPCAAAVAFGQFPFAQVAF